MLRSLEELRQIAEAGPAPEINWDVLNARIDKLPEVRSRLNASIDQMESAYSDLLQEAESSFDDPDDASQTLLTALGSALAIRIVESRVFARTLTTAEAVIEITR